MNQSLKVFLSCALGAFVGTLVALQANHHYWWAGLIAGFMVGYLGYDFKGAVNAIPTAWRSAAQSTRGFRTTLRADFHDARRYMRQWLSKPHPLVFPSLAIGMIAFGIMIHALWGLPMGEVGTKDDVLFDRFVSIGVSLVAGAIAYLMSLLLLGIFLLLGAEKNGCYWSSKSLELMTEKKCVVRVDMTYAHALRWTTRGAFVAVLAILKYFVIEKPVALGLFVWRYFKLIHSDVRLLCGVDAAIGALVGYFYHSAILGALVGGLWGLLNFEIFSVRILKCVPAERSLFH